MRFRTFVIMVVSLIVAGSVIVGCEDNSAPVSTAVTNNPTIQVDLLFEHDGCKVYHFNYHFDGHFYANCSPGVFDPPRGKSHYDDSVPTAAAVPMSDATTDTTTHDSVLTTPSN